MLNCLRRETDLGKILLLDYKLRGLKDLCAYNEQITQKRCSCSVWPMLICLQSEDETRVVHPSTKGGNELLVIPVLGLICKGMLRAFVITFIKQCW